MSVKVSNLASYLQFPNSYARQRSWGKVMFSQACVCPQVERVDISGMVPGSEGEVCPGVGMSEGMSRMGGYSPTPTHTYTHWT